MKAHLAKAEISRKEIIHLLRQTIGRMESIIANRDHEIVELRKKRMSSVCRTKAYQKHYKDAKAQLEAVLQCKAGLSEALIEEQARVNYWREAHKDTRKQFVDETAASLKLSRQVDELANTINAEVIRGDRWCYTALALLAVSGGLLASIVWG